MKHEPIRELFEYRNERRSPLAASGGNSDVSTAPGSSHSPAAASDELLHVSRSRRYLLVSPCRDEAQYLRRTLDSVASQSVPPALWVVVDDGSTDESAAILEEYSRQLPYLRVVRRSDRGG